MGSVSFTKAQAAEDSLGCESLGSFSTCRVRHFQVVGLKV